MSARDTDFLKVMAHTGLHRRTNEPLSSPTSEQGMLLRGEHPGFQTYLRRIAHEARGALTPSS